MRNLKLVLLFVPLITSCLSMMETAKIRDGFRYNPNVEYSKVIPKKSSWTVENQNPNVLGLGLKFSYGKLLDKKSRFGAELGLDFGMFFYPTVIGVVEYDETIDEHKIIYYPQSPQNIQVYKIFGRFAILQNKPTSVAFKFEMGGDRFASTGLVISRKVKKKEIYTGFKLFNRFIKTPEQKKFGSKYGEYFCLGIEIPTNKKVLETSKYSYIIMEVGIVNKLWYSDRPTFCVSAGLVIN